MTYVSCFYHASLGGAGKRLNGCHLGWRVAQVSTVGSP